MPDFSFDVVEDDGTRTRVQPSLYPGVDQAKKEACEAAGAIAKDLFMKSGSGLISVDVISEDGKARARARVMFLFDDLQ